MREMTREQLAGLIRKQALKAPTLRMYCRQRGVHISTLSNMLHGRNRFTPRVLRLLGLAHVQVVEQVDGAVGPLPVRRASTYRRMWHFGDWPSRYQPTGE